MRIETFEAIIPAAPEAVFQAFVNESLLRAWVCDDAKTHLRVNGTFQWIWNHGGYAAGIYKTVTTNKHLAFSWFSDGCPAESQVEITFTADGNATQVVVTHTFPEGDGWATPIENLSLGWRDSLKNLTYLYETGLDRRFMTRPMFGIYLEELTDENRAQVGVSIEAGIVITDVVAHGPADQAGFKKNDVLIKLGDTEIKTYYDLAAAQGKYRSDDTVKVELVNGDTHRVIDFTFGKRPHPDLPQTPDALADMLQSKGDDILSELAELLNGVPEEYLARRPAPDSWSVNDQLAHVIISERVSGLQSWGMAGAGGTYVWGGNNEMHLAGLKATHPTGEALTAELRRSIVEQAAMLRALSPTVAQNPAIMGQIGFGVVNFGLHIQSHFGQMREAIESAREAVPA